MAIPANCTQCGRPISQARLVNGAMKCKGCVQPSRAPRLRIPRGFALCGRCGIRAALADCTECRRCGAEMF